MDNGQPKKSVRIYGKGIVAILFSIGSNVGEQLSKT
jgi:hypothetical protein